MTRHRATRTVAGRSKGLFLAGRGTGQHIRARPHAAAYKDGLSRLAQSLRQIGMTWAESPRGAFAMHKQLAAAAIGLMLLDLARIVGHVEQQTEIYIRKEVAEDPARVVPMISRLASAQLMAARIAPR